jgi:hypothetical protein
MTTVVKTPSEQPRRSSTNTNYEDLDRLETAEGLVSIISLRRSTGVITFAIFKEYTRDGALEKSTFIPETLINAYIDLARLTEKRILELRASGQHTRAR